MNVNLMPLESMTACIQNLKVLHGAVSLEHEIFLRVSEVPDAFTKGNNYRKLCIFSTFIIP